MVSDPGSGDGASADEAPGADEIELLAAFERLSPQGSLCLLYTSDAADE